MLHRISSIFTMFEITQKSLILHLNLKITVIYREHNETFRFGGKIQFLEFSNFLVKMLMVHF